MAGRDQLEAAVRAFEERDVEHSDITELPPFGIAVLPFKDPTELPWSSPPRCSGPKRNHPIRSLCSTSIWSALDGSGLLKLGAWSTPTDPDRSRRTVWVIKRMIKRRDAASSATAQSTVAIGEADTGHSHQVGTATRAPSSAQPECSNTAGAW